MNIIEMANAYRGKGRADLDVELQRAREAASRALEDGSESEFLQCERVVQAIMLAISRLGRKA